MAGRVAGKRALVTGAAQGLGAQAATTLAREGAKVLCADINGEGAQATADAINEELGAGTAFAITHDVTDPDQWDAAIERAGDKLGGLSILLNNAGIGVRGNIETCTLEEWRRGFAVNVDSVLPGYNASKAAVWMLSKSVALYCAKMGWNIRCNSIHPTFVDTPILDGIGKNAGLDKEVVMGKLARQIPLGRVGKPQEIADGVLFLASDESSFMTAAELRLDGGISAM